jgi:hypothetical protein
VRGLLAIAAFLAALLTPLLAQAQTSVVSERPDKVSIVVYPQVGGLGLVMVTETRTVDLPVGPVKISFRDVADQIVAQTVAVQGLPDEVDEQNFDYQLLTPAGLIRASEGRMVTLVRTNPASGQLVQERARIVSGQNGTVLDFGGRIEAMQCSGGPERMVFDDLPPGFVAKPTLSLDTVSPRAGRVVLTLSYLATGVSWNANYVAHVAQDGRTLDLSSWITIANTSSTRFADAPIQVIAGRMQRTPGETRPVFPNRAPAFPNCWEINSGRIRQMAYMAGFVAGRGGDFNGAVLQAREAPMMAMAAPAPPPPPRPTIEDLGDYKLYTLPEPTTLAARQTKQLMMFEREGVKFERVYRQALSTTFGSGNPGQVYGPVPATITLRLKNEESDGLGLALPRGNFAVFETPPGSPPMLAGQTAIMDTAEGLPFDLTLGSAVNVQSQTRVLRRVREADRNTAQVEVVLTNAGAQAAVVEVFERGGQPSLEASAESHPHISKDGNLQWNVGVPAGSEVTVRYVLSWR